MCYSRNERNPTKDDKCILEIHECSYVLIFTKWKILKIIKKILGIIFVYQNWFKKGKNKKTNKQAKQKTV